ncbi:DUF488 domain-containing protein [uncultured Pseudoteredinibacter sp.]|uniref:DUF488 domain-containing protein n=1 Tax=uncultured Pseudoteredinibacter sp. TaxID=1641701 RepID=UPI002630956E|nr:DUF488 domain-containing protein [uncultured Pseudoteredinibacter sp.]
MTTLYTIGYATKPFDEFCRQLKQFNITALVDVRSLPFSRRFKEYDQPNLQRNLPTQSIHYIYMGDKLGPRSKDGRHYNSDRQIDFGKLQASKLFLAGIDRLKNGISKGYGIALMCAEKDPASCHRSLLIANFLEANSKWEIRHILHDGTLESQAELMHRLIDEHKLEQDMFSSSEDVRLQAYQAQCCAVNYRRPKTDGELVADDTQESGITTDPE